MHERRGQLPAWYIALEHDIEARIDTLLCLYEAEQPAVILAHLARAIIQAAHVVDRSKTWLHVIFHSEPDKAALRGADAPSLARTVKSQAAIHHPSVGDAEDLVDDLQRHIAPGPLSDSPVAIRIALLSTWRRLVRHARPTDRLLIAIEAIHLVDPHWLSTKP